jgi:hypothetical protein
MRTLLFFLLTGAPGCGGGDSGDDAADADADADTDSDADCPDSADLIGVWGVRADLGVILTERADSIVHLCPSPQQQQARLFLRLEVTDQNGPDVTQTVRICAVEFPSISGRAVPCDQDGEDVSVLITLGPELDALIQTIDIPGSGNLAADAAGCPTYHPSRAVVTLGTTFDDDSTPLPAWQDGCDTTPDECVTDFASLEDDDADAELGVTLVADSAILSGEAYVAFRTAPEMIGRVVDPDTIVGSVDPVLEYSIVDSAIEMSGLPTDTPLVKGNMPLIEPNPEGSEFTALRSTVIGDDTCEAIVNAVNLFD